MFRYTMFRYTIDDRPTKYEKQISEVFTDIRVLEQSDNGKSQTEVGTGVKVGPKVVGVYVCFERMGQR